MTQDFIRYIISKFLLVHWGLGNPVVRGFMATTREGFCQEMKKHLLAGQGELESEIRLRRELLQRADAHVKDMGDKAFMDHDAGLTSRVLQVLVRQRDSVVNALNRISAGTYGLCPDCGEQIPEGRLRAIPSSDLCLNCAEKDEIRIPIPSSLGSRMQSTPARH